MGTIMRYAVLSGVIIYCSAMAYAEEAVRPWAASVSAGASYNDNRDGTDGNKENNVDLFIQPRVDFIYRGEQTTLDLFYSPNLSWRSNPREDNENSPQNDMDIYHALGAILVHKFSERLNVRVSDNFYTTDDPQVDQNGVTVREDMSYLYNAALADVNMQLAENASATIGGGTALKRYDDNDVAANEDEDVTSLNGIFRYLMGSGYSVLAGVDHNIFDNSSTNLDRGSQVTTYAVGIEKYFLPTLSAIIKGGVQTIDYDSNTISSDTGGYGSAELRLTEGLTRFTVNAIYGYYGPLVRPYSSQIRTVYGAKVERDLSAALTLVLEGQYCLGEYDEERLEDGTTLPGGDDKMFLGIIKGTYKMSQRVSFDLGYQFEDWNSDVRESFTRNMVTALVKTSL